MLAAIGANVAIRGRDLRDFLRPGRVGALREAQCALTGSPGPQWPGAKGAKGTQKGPNPLDSCGRVWTLRRANFQMETEGGAVFQSGPVSPLHGFDSRRLHKDSVRERDAQRLRRRHAV